MQAKCLTSFSCSIESLEFSLSSNERLLLQSLKEAGHVRDLAVLKDVLRKISRLSAASEARYLRRRCNTILTHV